MWRFLLRRLVMAVPVVFGISGVVYAIAAAVLTGMFIRHAWTVYRHREGKQGERGPKVLFGYSIIYLFAMFGATLADRAAIAAWQAFA